MPFLPTKPAKATTEGVAGGWWSDMALSGLFGDRNFLEHSGIVVGSARQRESPARRCRSVPARLHCRLPAVLREIPTSDSILRSPAAVLSVLYPLPCSRKDAISFSVIVAGFAHAQRRITGALSVPQRASGRRSPSPARANQAELRYST